MNRLKTVNGVSLVAIATMLVNTLPAHAQQAEIDALKAEIAAMTERLSKLELESKDRASAEKKAPTVKSKAPATISGLLQVQANSLFGQKGPTAPTADTFRLRRAEIRISGKITNRISGTVMLDPAKNLTLVTPAAPAVPTVNQSSNILQELMLTYHMNSSEAGGIYLDAGQYKIPIGYEGDQVSSSALPFVNRALMYTVRDPLGGGYGDIRETGLRVRGDRGIVSYDLGVYNGFGDRQNTVAASDAKAIIGRVSLKPANMPGFMIGLSGGTGSTGAPRNDRQIINAFATYNKDKWLAFGEILQGDSQPIAGGATRDVRSYYGTVGYSITPKLQGVARYDYLDVDRNNPGFTVKDISLGLNYYIKGNNAKIQANIVRRNGTGVAAPAAGASGSGLGGLANDSTALILQGQVAF